jgi:serine protease Do
MKRLVVFLLCAGAATASRADVDRAMLIGLGASVLKVEAVNARGGYSIGSAVVVAPESVVTNCHVTRNALKVDVTRGGARWRTEARASDFEHDLCLLHVPGLRAEAVAIGRADALATGQSLVSIGYTGGVEIQHSEGEVISLHRLDGGRVIQSSNWFSSGASGGGLFDADRRLVGILTFRLRGGEAHAFAAPAEWLRGMLASAGSAATTTTARGPDEPDRLAYWQRPAESRPWFLKAAVLQRDDRWAELAALASDWADAEAADPEPWRLMGQAFMQMNRPAEARRAIGCAIAIEPGAAVLPAPSASEPAGDSVASANIDARCAARPAAR